LSPARLLYDLAFSGNRTRVNQHITNRQRFNDREMTARPHIVAKVSHFFEAGGAVRSNAQSRTLCFALN